MQSLISFFSTQYISVIVCVGMIVLLLTDKYIDTRVRTIMISVHVMIAVLSVIDYLNVIDARYLFLVGAILIEVFLYDCYINYHVGNTAEAFVVVFDALSVLGALLIKLFAESFVVSTGFLYEALHVSMLFYYIYIRGQCAEAKTRAREEFLERQRTEVLCSQVNSHFIYNALMAVMGIENNPPETISSLATFGKFIRGNLSVLNRQDSVPFQEELEQTKNYLKLETLRFGDKLEIVYDIQNEDFQLPILSLQMLAENAVRHGLIPKKGGGRLEIRSYLEGEYNIVTVRDNGIGFDKRSKEYQKNHPGIYNIADRLKTQVNGKIRITSVPGEGTFAEIYIPVNRRL